MIADLHAITVLQDPKELKANVEKTVATCLAYGINPHKTTFFRQSAIPAHLELAWIFSCLTPLGWLNRMTQFKEKSKENSSLGLYAYPTLMAADILLYRPDLVSIGEDQKQHLELTRDIAILFNKTYEKGFFPLPKPLMARMPTRIMSLQDGRKKMSKSDLSDFSRINLTDSPDLIKSKIQKAKTDSLAYISYEPETRPEIANLLNIFASLTDYTLPTDHWLYQDDMREQSYLSGKSVEFLVDYFSGWNISKFKSCLTDAIIGELEPIHKSYTHFKGWYKDLSAISLILDKGQEEVDYISYRNMVKIKSLVGIEKNYRSIYA